MGGESVGRGAPEAVVTESPVNDDRIVQLVKAFDLSLDAGRAQLAADPTSINLRSSLGETPLHLACFETPTEALRELIEAGAEVDTLSDCGSSPLSDSALVGRADVVNLLIERGASLLLDGQLDLTLHQAVRGRNVEVVRAILEAGADVNERQTDFSETALHIAAELDLVEIAEFLVANGAESTTRCFNETALEIAIRMGNERCVALLSSKH